MTVHI